MTPLLVDGEATLTGDSFTVTSPADGTVVGRVAGASLEVMERAVVAASRAAAPWARLPQWRRREALEACARVLRENIESLATLQTRESGRPVSETRIEVMVAAANFEAAGKYMDIDSEEFLFEDAETEKRVVVRQTPLGVVAVIAPWNAPIVLGWKPTATALACGNAVVLKPSPQTPLTTLRIGDLLQPFFPPGLLNVVVGADRDEFNPGSFLSNHPMVNKVVFTGSTEVGRKVMTACANSFTRVLLELGGNDPAIIRQDCNIEETVEGVFKAAFFNNGQTCVAIKRLYVQEDIFEPFVEALVARARKAVLGNGLREGVELGPLASDVQLRAVNELLEDARKNGAQVLCGGAPIAGPPGEAGTDTGLFFLPTIVTGIEEGTRLVDEEQFGPVLPVMPFKTDEEAIRRANNTQFGLGASVWSADVETANRLADQLRAGMVWVNRHCEFIRTAPFGGMEQSGIGRSGDLAKRDLAEYTEAKTMVLAMVPKAKTETARLSSYSSVCVEVGEEHRKQLLERLAGPWGKRLAVAAAQGQEAAVKAAATYLPQHAAEALASLSRPEGPPCVLVRGLPPEMGPQAQDAIMMAAAGVLDAGAFMYRGSSSDTLARDRAEEPGWHRSGRSNPPYDPPRRHNRPEELVADFCLTLCQAADCPLAVRIADFRAVYEASSAEDLELLKRTPLAFFDTQAGHWLEPAAVVQATGPAPAPPIVDLRCPERFEPAGAPEAVAAYSRLHEAAEAVAETVSLEAGDILVVGNKRCLHAWEGGGDAPRHSGLLRSVLASCAAASWPSRVVQ